MNNVLRLGVGGASHLVVGTCGRQNGSYLGDLVRKTHSVGRLSTVLDVLLVHHEACQLQWVEIHEVGLGSLQGVLHCAYDDSGVFVVVKLNLSLSMVFCGWVTVEWSLECYLLVDGLRMGLDVLSMVLSCLLLCL